MGYYESATVYQTLILHWDGLAWTQTPSPNVGTNPNYLNAITVVSATDVWAVGYYASGTNMTPTLILHWDGSAWSVVPSPSVAASFNYLASVDGVAANDVWTVGYAVQNSIAHTLILHWDGSAWTQTPSPNIGTSHNDLNGLTAVSATDVGRWAPTIRGACIERSFSTGTAWPGA